MAFPTDWKYKLAITINSGDIDADLNDWTLVFDQSFDAVLTQVNGPLDADGTRPSINGGGDVRFSSDSAGSSRLSCDIREWTMNDDPSLATVEVAVKVASVSSSVDVTIYMWWGKVGETQPSVSDAYGQYNAYDSDYEGIYSLSETTLTGTDAIKDRTSNQRHGTSTGLLDSDSDTGKVGNSIDFPGNARISLGSGTFLDNKMTISMMVNLDSQLQYAAYIGRASSNNWTDGWGLYSDSGIAFFVSEWTHAPKVTVSNNVWTHLCGTYDSTTIRLYKNAGTPTTYAETVGVLENGILYIGGYIGNYDGVCDGNEDEVRISSVTRSSAWVKADYSNQFDASGFLTWGGILDTAAKPRSFGYIIG